MKGVTTVELTNEKTGEKKTYKDENMITNLYRDLCQPAYPLTGGLVDYYRRSQSSKEENIKQLTQGLVMFDSTLTEDADDYLIKSGINMVGRGVDTAYSGQDPTLGSYDETESAITDTIKYVWQFNSNQANGTIRSICLCPTVAAKVGFGKNNDSSIGSIAADIRSFSLRGCRDNGYTNYAASGLYRYYDFENNKMYEIQENSELYKNLTITIKEYRMPSKNSSIFDDYSSNMLLRKHTIELPAEIKGLANTAITQGCTAAMYNNTFSVVFGYYANSKIPANGTIYCFEINLSTMQGKLKSYPNATGGDIGVQNMNLRANSNKNFLITENYFVYKNEKKLYVYNKETHSIMEVKKADGSEFVYEKTMSEGMINVGDIVIGACQSEKMLLMLDCKSAVMKKLDGTSSNSGSYNSDYSFDYGSRDFSLINKILFLTANGIHVFPLVLFTKNNLSTPIVKTSEQSMKITYELIKE